MGTPVTMFSESAEDPFALHRAATAVLDSRGRVAGWSERAELLLGHTGREVIGRSALDVLVDPRDRPAVGGVAADCTAARGWFGVLPVRHRDGHRVELGLRARVVTRADAVEEWFLVAAPAAEAVQWELDRAVLDGMFRRSPIGLVVHSPDIRILRVNRAIARVSGITPQEHVGLSSAELLVAEDAEAVRNRLRQVLETGRPAIFTEQPSRLRRDPHSERMVSVSAFRLEDSAGRVIGVTELVEDVTDRFRARRRLALLNRAGARVGTTLDVGRTARELADVAVPELADRVSVDVLEPVSRGEDPFQETTGPVCRMAVRGVSARDAQMMHPVGAVIRLPPQTPQARCLAERRAVLEPAVGSAVWHALEPPAAEAGTEAGAGVEAVVSAEAGADVHSLMVAPLAARGLVLGVVSLWRSEHREPFEEDDLTLAQELASRAALSIDNARRYTQQQQAALSLQRSLLPLDVPEYPAVEVAHRYLPAGGESGLGGDWFDVIPLSGTRVALVVGDVVGHGIHAAAMMGRLRTAVHTLAGLDLEPDEVLSRLDDLVGVLAAEQEAAGATGGGPRPAEQIVGATCLYAVYDPISRRCAIASAGHPPPAAATPEGRVSLLDLPAGPPLGLGGLPFEMAEFELAEGTVLALYTNGLIQERRGDIDERLARLRAALTRPAQPLEQTCQAVLDSVLRGHPADDVALLLARTRVLPPAKVASWQLPVDAGAAARARELTAATLTEWGLEHLVFTTELIASELVTNAYRYASGPVVLRLIHDRSLICEVSDAGSTAPHLRRARSTDEGGRGLFLVAQFTERWGTRYTRDGKTVWTEQSLSGR